MTTQDADKTAIRPTESAGALAIVIKGELATTAGAKAGQEAFGARCNKATKRLGLGSLGTLLGIGPAAVLVHAMFPVVLVSSVLTGGAIACVSLGLFSLVVLANTPDKSTEDGGQKTDQDRCARIKAAAESAFDQVIANATLHENEIVFFNDPSEAGGKLALCVSEVREYREDAQLPQTQRIVARVYTAPLAGEEFAKSPEIAGVGPIVRERPIPSAIDLILAEATAKQSRDQLPPAVSTRPLGVGALPPSVDVSSCA